MATVIPRIDVGDNYKEKYGFFDPEKYVFKAKRGLSPEVVKEISWMKNEPEWMTTFRLRALKIWEKKEMPTWGADLSMIDFQNIYYYLKSTEKQGKTWDDVPADIKNTFDRLGVPQAERKFLAGVAAQYESEVVYHSLHKELEAKGVIFTDTDSALRDYPDLFKQYFGTIIPPGDNKLAALNSAVWSGGSFIYVTKRAVAYGDATMEWVDGNLGSQITMKYPSIYLMEPGAKGDVLSVAFAGKGQHQDAGGKAVHVAPNTSSNIVSKSISKNGGRTSYRGLVKVYPGAKDSKSFVRCDALPLDDASP